MLGREASSSTGWCRTRGCRGRCSPTSAIRAGTSGAWPTCWRGEMTAARAFEGVTVLELGHFVAVPWAGPILADGGAHVIKIEPRDGEPSRRMSVPGGKVRYGWPATGASPIAD